MPTKTLTKYQIVLYQLLFQIIKIKTYFGATRHFTYNWTLEIVFDLLCQLFS